jgi:hypothetical protein
MGSLNPGFEPSLEVEARGSPDISDLRVGFNGIFMAVKCLFLSLGLFFRRISRRLIADFLSQDNRR